MLRCRRYVATWAKRVALSLTWRGKLSPSGSWQRRCSTVPWMKDLFGLTSRLSNPDSPMPSLLECPAKASASRDHSSDSSTVDQDSGSLSFASLKNQEPSSFSLRMCLESGPQALDKSSKILPSSGSMRSGVVSRQPRLAPRIEEIVSSCLDGDPQLSPLLTDSVRERLLYVTGEGGSLLDLLWATPLARDWKSSVPVEKDNSRPLAEEVLIWAVQSGLREDLILKDGLPLSSKFEALNPAFVEMLMGYPLGWTLLEPLEGR